MLVHPDALFRTSIDAHREHLDRAARAAAASPAAPRARADGPPASPAIGRGRLGVARP